MADARALRKSKPTGNGTTSKSGKAPAEGIEVLWDLIAQSLQEEAPSKSPTNYSTFEHVAEVAFSPKNTHFSRFAGPITALNRLISDALSLVAASSEAASKVLYMAPRLMPYVTGASPTVAWGLIDLIETALWCTDELEFTSLRAGRLLLLSYFKSHHNTLEPCHALAMTFMIARLHDLPVDKLIDTNVPLVVQLLALIGQQDEAPSKYGDSLEELYWSDCDYLRLAVNTLCGVRLPTLMKVMESIGTGIKGPRDDLDIANCVNTRELVCLLLFTKSKATQGLDLGICSNKLHTLLSKATTELEQIDGPALVLKKKLEILIDTSVWLLSLQKAPLSFRGINEAQKATRLGCDAAVSILSTGTNVFKPHTCIGACLLLLRYTRSVHALTTEDVVSVERTDELCQALKRLLIEEPENGVDEAVAGLLCNLLMYFSRFRNALLDIGIVPTLCDALYRNQSNCMLANTLWALRNLCTLCEGKELEQQSLRSLDRVGVLKPLLANEDREVTRLFCAFLGNMSPANIDELYELLGGRAPVAQYLTQRIEYWQWPCVQEAASQALVNLIAAMAVEDREPDRVTRDLCQGIVRCLKHPDASETLLANVGYVISNALQMSDDNASGAKTMSSRQMNLTSLSRPLLGALMLQEGVYEALKGIDSPKLSVRNSVGTARHALEVTTAAGTAAS